MDLLRNILITSSQLYKWYFSIALTKLDVLDSFDKIKIAVSYELDGEELLNAPGIVFT